MLWEVRRFSEKTMFWGLVMICGERMFWGVFSGVRIRAWPRASFSAFSGVRIRAWPRASFSAFCFVIFILIVLHSHNAFVHCRLKISLMFFSLLIEELFTLAIEVPHIFAHRVPNSKGGAVLLMPGNEVIVLGWDVSYHQYLGRFGRFGRCCSNVVVCRRLFHSTGAFR
jgi:hypothetical protein